MAVERSVAPTAICRIRELTLRRRIVLVLMVSGKSPFCGATSWLRRHEQIMYSLIESWRGNADL